MYPTFDLICLSHLRWDPVYQRPHHLLARAARDRRVVFVEEPLLEGGERPHFRFRHTVEGITVAVPVLPIGLSPAGVDRALSELLRSMVRHMELHRYVLWLYNPMAVGFSNELEPLAVVYDYMGEVCAPVASPLELADREAELLRRADVVFTGGRSLYHAKRQRHPNVHGFPSAVDFEHFSSARGSLPEPADQIFPRPRAGFFGVIDERMDLELVDGLAGLRPGLQLVMIGPVAGIDPASLPRRPNLHWLGPRPYRALPEYIRGWDVAILPLARNEAGRIISPPSTPEYLAAGKPVVSTSVRDVVFPWGLHGLVRIADSPAAFASSIDAALQEDGAGRVAQADHLVKRMSWDRTWSEMQEVICRTVGDVLLAEALDHRRRGRLAPPVPATSSASQT